MSVPMTAPLNIKFQSKVHQTLVMGRVIYYAPDGQSYYFVTSERSGSSEQNGHEFPVRRYSIRKVDPNGYATYAEGTTKGQFRWGQIAHDFAKKLGTRDPSVCYKAGRKSFDQIHREAMIPEPKPAPVAVAPIVRKVSAPVPAPAPKTPHYSPTHQVFKIMERLTMLKAQIQSVEIEIRKMSIPVSELLPPFAAMDI